MHLRPQQDAPWPAPEGHEVDRAGPGRSGPPPRASAGPGGAPRARGADRRAPRGAGRGRASPRSAAAGQASQSDRGEKEDAAPARRRAARGRDDQAGVLLGRGAAMLSALPTRARSASPEKAQLAQAARAGLAHRGRGEGVREDHVGGRQQAPPLRAAREKPRLHQHLVAAQPADERRRDLQRIGDPETTTTAAPAGQRSARPSGPPADASTWTISSGAPGRGPGHLRRVIGQRDEKRPGAMPGSRCELLEGAARGGDARACLPDLVAPRVRASPGAGRP